MFSILACSPKIFNFACGVHSDFVVYLDQPLNTKNLYNFIEYSVGFFRRHFYGSQKICVASMGATVNMQNHNNNVLFIHKNK